MELPASFFSLKIPSPFGGHCNFALLSERFKGQFLGFRHDHLSGDGNIYSFVDDGKRFGLKEFSCERVVRNAHTTFFYITT